MKHDIPALLKEAAELPNPQRSILTHNERVLIEFCQRLAAALKEASNAAKVKADE